ncbi:MAG: SET domain-containing protein-lysine N-methyltransferase [Candidatus Omnitrophica bacterium]|nr:SET domain-containing protein-lysine N-methyltransferase [Candidatus Omnitrophota bacterium]
MISHSYLTAKANVREDSINRKGIFAREEIKKDALISIWGGAIVTGEELGRLAQTVFKGAHDYATVIAEGFYMVSSKDGTLEDDDFFNHSCDPNAGMRGNIVLVAMRDIQSGEEITYDYMMTDADYDYSFHCACSSMCCRKVITGRDWMIKELQEKYRGYFTWHVENKIRQMT